MLPGRQAIDQTEPANGFSAVSGGAMAGDIRARGEIFNSGQVWKRQQGNKCQHRDYGNVLKQQHGKTGLPAIGFQQTFFIQRLQHNGGRRQGKDQSDCQ